MRRTLAVSKQRRDTDILHLSGGEAGRGRGGGRAPLRRWEWEDQKHVDGGRVPSPAAQLR